MGSDSSEDGADPSSPVERIAQLEEETLERLASFGESVEEGELDLESVSAPDKITLETLLSMGLSRRQALQALTLIAGGATVYTALMETVGTASADSLGLMGTDADPVSEANIESEDRTSPVARGVLGAGGFEEVSVSDAGDIGAAINQLLSGGSESVEILGGERLNMTTAVTPQSSGDQIVGQGSDRFPALEPDFTSPVFDYASGPGSFDGTIANIGCNAINTSVPDSFLKVAGGSGTVSNVEVTFGEFGTSAVIDQGGTDFNVTFDNIRIEKNTIGSSILFDWQSGSQFTLSNSILSVGGAGEQALVSNSVVHSIRGTVIGGPGTNTSSPGLVELRNTASVEGCHAEGASGPGFLCDNISSGFIAASGKNLNSLVKIGPNGMDNGGRLTVYALGTALDTLNQVVDAANATQGTIDLYTQNNTNITPENDPNNVVRVNP